MEDAAETFVVDSVRINDESDGDPAHILSAGPATVADGMGMKDPACGTEECATSWLRDRPGGRETRIRQHVQEYANGQRCRAVNSRAIETGASRTSPQPLPVTDATHACPHRCQGQQAPLFLSAALPVRRGKDCKLKRVDERKTMLR